MSLLSPLNNAFGLDIGDRSLKLVQVGPHHKPGTPFRITAWGNIDVPEGILDRGEINDIKQATAQLSKLLSRTTGHLRGRAVVACLPEARSFVKVIELSGDTNKAAVAKAVSQEIEQNIPLPINEIYYDWHLVDESISEPEAKKSGEKRKKKGKKDEKGKDAAQEKPEEEPEKEGQEPKKGEEKAEEAAEQGTDKPEKESGKESEEEAVEEQEQKDTKPIRVMLAAAPKQLVDNYVKMIEGAGLAPVALEIEATAIARAMVPMSDTLDNPLGILDIGATRSSLIVCDQGAMQMSISIPISGNELTRIISEKLNISLADAELVKIECGLDAHRCEDKMWNILLPMIDDMAAKIRNALRFYRIGFPSGKKVERMVLCGGGAHFRDIDNVLSRKLTIKVRRGDPLVNVNRLPKRFAKDAALSYTTALGLALRASNERERYRHSFRL
jgi:Tfp pilus assembly PilM family ATPase